jgi:hypothetical protein
VSEETIKSRYGKTHQSAFFLWRLGSTLIVE